jgi:putative membrane protein
MRIDQIHPAINAALNLTSFVFLLLGRWEIARGNDAVHKRRMLTAFGASSVFLVSYLIRYATTGTHKYPGTGWDKYLYLFILFSHMALALVLVPLLLTALRRALKSEFEAHKRVVKYAFPIWVYVSAAGVIVYLMLYHLAPALHSAT